MALKKLILAEKRDGERRLEEAAEQKETELESLRKEMKDLEKHSDGRISEFGETVQNRTKNMWKLEVTTSPPPSLRHVANNM